MFLIGASFCVVLHVESTLHQKINRVFDFKYLGCLVFVLLFFVMVATAILMTKIRPWEHRPIVVPQMEEGV